VSDAVPRKKGISAMYQLSLVRRRVLLVPLFVASFACDAQSESPTSESPATSALTRRAVSDPSSASRAHGRAQVEVVFNAAPRVDSLVSSSGRVSSGAPVTLQVTASDPDGDVLGFSWTSSCPGTFDHLDKDQVTFVCGRLATGMNCTFEVAVSDGHGGAGKGRLILSSAMPVINVAPALGIVYQTANAADPGEVVLLHASATDPEGAPLVWTWKASDGALLEQKDQTGSSDIHWTAPSKPGADCTITATATDLAGASTSYVFKVRVVGV
jgi:hypothetical protein